MFRVKPELATALERIEQARKKPVAFAVRANVAFYGVPCDDCPAAGNQVSFDGKSFFLDKKLSENQTKLFCSYFFWPASKFLTRFFSNKSQ